MSKVVVHLWNANGTKRKLAPSADFVRLQRAHREAVLRAEVEERELAALPPEILFIARTRNGWLRCTRGLQRGAQQQFEYWRSGVARAVSARHAQHMLDRTYPSAPSGPLPQQRTVSGCITI